MHTNYTELAIRTGGFGVGYVMCGLMHTINWCLCGMHCHRVRCSFSTFSITCLCFTLVHATSWHLCCLRARMSMHSNSSV